MITEEDLQFMEQTEDPYAPQFREMLEQIATLKTALVDHIAQDKIAQMGGFGFVLDTATCDPYGDARKQLARELPEIFAEDQ